MSNREDIPGRVHFIVAPYRIREYNKPHSKPGWRDLRSGETGAAKTA
jgi:hypothetical protein